MDTVELFEEDDDFVMEAATDFISIASALVISRNETTNSTIGSFVSNVSNVRHLNPSMQVRINIKHLQFQFHTVVMATI